MFCFLEVAVFNKSLVIPKIFNTLDNGLIEVEIT
jgi:hypothetical protein